MKVEYIFDTAKFLVKNNKFYFAQLFNYYSTSTMKPILNKNTMTKPKIKLKLKENSNDSKMTAKKIKLETITSNHKQPTISTNKEHLKFAEVIDSKSDLISKMLKAEPRSPKKKQSNSRTSGELKVRVKEEPNLISENDATASQLDEAIDEKKLNFDFSN